MDLKAAYDAVVSAVAEAQAIAQQIEALFAEGKTDEALALRDDFKAAQTKADELKSLYDDMTSVMKGDVAKMFVPAAKRMKEDAEGPKTMTRADFDALSPAEQSDFVLVQKGKVVDEEVTNG